MLALRMFLVFSLLFNGVIIPEALAKTKQSRKIATENNKVISDNWYTIQSGSSPWGYYHEIIEERKSTKGTLTYSYRYFMLKRERKVDYRENIGALAKEDLTPITFNINKAGLGAAESINGTFKEGSPNSSFAIKVSGARVKSMQRAVAKGTILEVFLPIWLAKQWDRFTPGARGDIKVFAENSQNNDFKTRRVVYQVKGLHPKQNCMQLDIDVKEVSQSEWCIHKSGEVEFLNIIGKRGELLVQVKKTKNEDSAVKFLGPSKK